MSLENIYSDLTISNGSDHAIHNGIIDEQHSQSTDGMCILKINVILFCVDSAHQTDTNNDTLSNFTDLTSVSQKSEEG